MLEKLVLRKLADIFKTVDKITKTDLIKHDLIKHTFTIEI
jgi:hypothetical protein